MGVAYLQSWCSFRRSAYVFVPGYNGRWLHLTQTAYTVNAYQGQ